MSERKQITFGVMLQGAGGHMNAWKHPSGPVDASTNFEFFVNAARKAEAAGIAFAFVADGLYVNEQSIPHFLNRFEPISILSALAASTSKIGLVGTVSTSYSDPFTIARQFASLALISGGRYEIADEYLDVIKGLWDSWDDNAFVRDRENGVYVDKNKLRRINHKGRFFNVEGPLNISRSRQGQPVVFQAGSSDSGIRLAGKHADAVFTNGAKIEDVRSFYRQVKQSAVAQGRSSSDVGIFPGIGPIVGRTQEEADAKYQAIRNLVSVEEALLYLGRFFDHHDFSIYPLDEPFPELGEIGKNSFRATTDRIKKTARETGATLREIALDVATPRTAFIGTAEAIANELIDWVESEAADGFILGFPVIAEGLDDFIQHVLPILEERGYFNPELSGETLRDHLGLPFRESRYSSAVDQPVNKAARA